MPLFIYISQKSIFTSLTSFLHASHSLSQTTIESKGVHNAAWFDFKVKSHANCKIMVRQLYVNYKFILSFIL